MSGGIAEFVASGPSHYLELPAIAAGCLSGGAHAVRKGFDAIGVVVLSIVTGLGGGFARDLVLGHLPPLSLVKPIYLLVGIASAVVAFFASRAIARVEKLLTFIDAAALGFFATVGAQQALAASLPMASVIATAVICAVGGGVMRDVLSSDVPSILAPGQLYASVAAVGGLVYVTCDVWLGTSRPWAELAAVGITLLFRNVAVWRDWRGPLPLREHASAS
jgi:uncharacterized membrane protein YeiH